jgi:CheY-like chemotaxis protein
MGVALDVLVVEDDPDMQVALAELLGGIGHSVRRAGHGQEALALLASGWRPQLVLLDMVMPVMDGFEFLARKKAIAALESIPVVVISATAVPPIDGVRQVLRKPVEVAELIEVVEAVESGGPHDLRPPDSDTA